MTTPMQPGPDNYGLVPAPAESPAASGVRVATGVVAILTSLWVGLMGLLLSVSDGGFTVTFLGIFLLGTALSMFVAGIILLTAARGRTSPLPVLLLGAVGITVVLTAIAPVIGASEVRLPLIAAVSVVPLTVLSILTFRQGRS